MKLLPLLTLACALSLSAIVGLPTNAHGATTNAAVAEFNTISSRLADPALTSTFNMENLDDKHKLVAGDRVLLKIVEDQEDPKPLLVMDSGDLDVPYIGRFPVATNTCKKVAYAIKAELEQEFYYQATVIISLDLKSTRTRGKIYVGGQVYMAGAQEMPVEENFTVSRAILRAGGFRDFADKRKVKLIRKSGSPDGRDLTYVIDVEQVLDRSKTELDKQLEPDDIVIVPARLVNF